MLRRAGHLFVEHEDEIHGWLMRESGAIRPFAGFQTRAVAAEECCEAAALASHPYGELLRSNQPRLSMARRLPVGRRRRDRAVQRADHPGDPRGRAGAGAGQRGDLKPDPRTAVSGGVVFARIFEEAGLPPGLLHVLPGGADVGEALVDDPLIRVIAFTGSTRAGRIVAALAGAAPQAGAPGARRQLGADRARRRRRREGGRRSGALGSFDHAGPDLHGHRPAPGAAAASPSDYTAALAEHADQLPVGDPTRDRRRAGPDHRRRPARQRPPRGHRVRRRRGARWPPAAPTRACSTGRRCWPTCPLDRPGLRARRSSARSPRSSRSRPLDEAVALAAGTEYGLSLGILTRDVMKGLALAERIPSGLVHINDQTVNDEALIPFGGVGDSGTGSRHGGAQANLDAFTETQWVTVRGDLPQYPF